MALADLERDGHGYLVDLNTWDRGVAAELAEEEGVNLTDESFKLIDFLREEYINNNANQPNERNMVKGLKDNWEGKLTTKELYTLFPKGPAKQAGKIAGLPETKRKGGY
ncbi:Similar to tRNA 2-thiouridine synthesis protein TusE and issimilatory sulfite reductase, gamma subunit [Bathymodiolus thermophilus thioautotrophic gill symbiont]|jgi:tRNA 2-thiouridine synthesizing protein E|uniref:Sulfurtransferase n=1 Tax=Bathymodiolus thermophilus thioautotrophic gill symbiont TaxID=2360 RepID=A0A1J5U5T8_9GAMM|nr:TusE/DsrC/DsvC family sulfur relay protein [Bathymodiolus thermophilus thioautotrophic gill symbiont]AYQ56644.1 tRNA 2-thiouridine synthesizing protein E [Bathymodiolus thermophilus thioautotrophic gill symbiont]OIR23761.1 sulfur relay protein DsrC [Bathymodiolus thermophilus thioautotrophic gill symbiont]CAB5498008.1 Similar to tRNA 2-thiouridine synthesis protein TusE and issimilatory sulfite reductase, gamma subunit [Bathymodiolus thermophilus thioautotrophic gill symbiont]CAB5503263.1 Si